MRTGHIYIAMNPTMSGYLKIGMTTRSPDERVRELSQPTGVAAPYVLADSKEVVTAAEVPRADLREDMFPLPSLAGRRQASPALRTPTEQELIDTLPADLQRDRTSRST